MESPFIHGSFKFARDNRVLVIEGHGPWNQSALEACTEAARPHLENLLDGQPWAVLLMLHGQLFYTPEASENLFELLVHDCQIGRIASALVVDAQVSDVERWHLEQIYSAAGARCEFFEDCQQAQAWLAKELKAANCPAKAAN